jgi:hypothetical protein
MKLDAQVSVAYLPFSVGTGIRKFAGTYHSFHSQQNWVLGHFDCGARILRVIHVRDARATFKVTHHPKLMTRLGKALPVALYFLKTTLSDTALHIGQSRM